jgi:hypothetical protein
LKRYFPKCLLTLIFTLLQCALPLVHAHVNGIQSGMLPPSLNVQQQQSNHDILKSANFIEENESPAITIPHEFQRNNPCSIPQPQLGIILELPRLFAITLKPTEVQPIIVSSPYNKPHTQAPPGLG